MQQRLLIVLLVACSSAQPKQPQPKQPDQPQAEQEQTTDGTTFKRTVVIGSRRAGTSVTTIRGDELQLAYEHLDNGRGPKVEARAKVGSDGTLVSFEASGTKTMGGPIDEKFSVEGKIAKWKSTEEDGDRVLDGSAFFVPLAPLPDLVAILFAALQKAGGTLRLLPGGEARLERTRETTVKNAAGQEKKLVGWMIIGFDFTPFRFWTEEDGTYFGLVDGWYACVAEGWEVAIEPLVALQREMDAERDKELAQKLGRPIPEAGLAIKNARVLDVLYGKWLEEHTVVIQAGKILALGPTKRTKIPPGAEVIDAENKAVLPGLWDMHTHLGPADGPLYLASGVTTVRDLANDPDRVDDYKKRFEEKTAIGPRVLRSGFIEGRGEKASGSKITAETEEEAKAAVEFYHQRGYEGIKIYNSVKPELVPLLAKLAHEKGMRVSGHVPHTMLAEDVVKAGYDEIQHINMIFLNFVGDRTIDTRTPLRFSTVAEKGADLDLKSAPVKSFIKLLQRKKIAVDPTLNAFEDLFLARPGKPLPSIESIRVRLPLQVQRYYKTEGLPVPDGKDEQYQKSFQRMLEMVKLLHASGIPLVAGTDSLAAGLTLHYELSLYSRAGIGNASVLRIATIGAARVMKRQRYGGTIAEGKDADLFLVDGDPLAQIDDLRKVVTTIRGDVMYRASDLYSAVGVRPRDQ